MDYVRDVGGVEVHKLFTVYKKKHLFTFFSLKSIGPFDLIFSLKSIGSYLGHEWMITQNNIAFILFNYLIIFLSNYQKYIHEKEFLMKKNGLHCSLYKHHQLTI